MAPQTANSCFMPLLYARQVSVSNLYVNFGQSPCSAYAAYAPLLVPFYRDDLVVVKALAVGTAVGCATVAVACGLGVLVGSTGGVLA